MAGRFPIGIAFLLGCASIAHAQQASDALPGPADATGAAPPWIESIVSLKAAGGRLNKWKKNLPCENGRFSTDVTFSQLTPEKPWESAVQLLLRNEEKNVAARFNLNTEEFSPAYLYANLDSGSRTASGYFTERVPAGEPTHMTLTWLNSRTVIAAMGAQHYRLNLKEPINELELLASGGSATFANNLLECTKE